MNKLENQELMLLVIIRLELGYWDYFRLMSSGRRYLVVDLRVPSCLDKDTGDWCCVLIMAAITKYHRLRGLT